MSAPRISHSKKGVSTRAQGTLVLYLASGEAIRPGWSSENIMSVLACITFRLTSSVTSVTFWGEFNIKSED